LCNSFIDSKLEVIWNSYGERLRLGVAADTANYAYGKFDKYAQNLLINTLEQLLNESSDDTLCTAALSQTVLVAAAALDSASPLQLRLDAERSLIPHYTNALSVSLMHSFLVLLYGLFFNIFTSLYIYKKKKNTCGADEEKPEPQNESTNS